jgi:hypothetical protein
MREEKESLQSTSRRFSRCDGATNQSGRMDSPRSSGFRVAIKMMSSGSNFVQVLGMAPSSKGAPIVNNVMGPDDGDGSKYIPH